MRHERLEDKDTGEERDEDRTKQEDDGQTRKDPEFPAPPRDRLVLRPALLNAERTARAPAHGEHALLNPPPLDERDRPEEQQRRVQR